MILTMFFEISTIYHEKYEIENLYESLIKVNNVLSNNQMNKQTNDDASHTIRMRHSVFYLCLRRDYYRLIFRSFSTIQFFRPLQKQPLKLTSLINLLEDPDGVPYLVYIYRLTKKTRNKYQKLLAVNTIKRGREDIGRWLQRPI